MRPFGILKGGHVLERDGLYGGSLPQTLPTGQVVSFIAVILVINVVLTALMWSDTIGFATRTDRTSTATVMSVLVALLTLYLLYLATSGGHCKLE